VSFALGTFSQDDGKRFAAICIGDSVYPLFAVHDMAVRSGATWTRASSVLDILQQWDSHLPVLRALAERLGGLPELALAAASLRVHPPVDLPRQILCTGANYRKHVVDMTIDQGIGPEGLSGSELKRWAENMMDERAARGEPYVFVKLPSAITGPSDPIVLPPTTAKPDWELELGVVIGRAARNVHRDDALDYVAGYAIVNDISARDLIPRTDYKLLGTDWLVSKSPPTFLPFGPHLVPACFVEKPQDLRLLLKLNGQVMQDESTADMIFGIARQIEYISWHVQLWPGDLICTGSPAGNGTHYNRYLQPGDVIEASIEGLGVQRNLCITPAEADVNDSSRRHSHG